MSVRTVKSLTGTVLFVFPFLVFILIYIQPYSGLSRTVEAYTYTSNKVF